MSARNLEELMNLEENERRHFFLSLRARHPRLSENFSPGPFLVKLFPGKLRSKWSGPFLVKQVNSHGAIELEDPASQRSWTFPPKRGGASFKATILVDSRPGENPSLKRGYRVKIFWVCRLGEKILPRRYMSEHTERFSPRRDIFAQAKVSRPCEKFSPMERARIQRTKSTAHKNHPPPKKHKSGTSGQATPSYNRNKFTSLEREERYNTLLQWTFVPERRVELQRNEYLNFLTRLDELKWGTLTSPHNKFDPDMCESFMQMLTHQRTVEDFLSTNLGFEAYSFGMTGIIST
ncbi:hypothetical protein Lal_00025764 [Lupinus albus]|nr:hypothetical protein Lal_00025764 [Lupinus albus]